MQIGPLSLQNGLLIAPFSRRDQAYFVPQADGRFRSRSLHTDVEYLLRTYSEEYEPASWVTLKSMPEGGYQEANIALGPKKPTWDFQTLDGQEHSFDDYRGKYVLIYLYHREGTTWQTELPHLKAAYDAFGKDERFVMITLDNAPTRRRPEDPRAMEIIRSREHLEAAREFLAGSNLPWIQGIGNYLKPEAIARFGLRGAFPSFLLNPEGKVIARDLHGEQIKEAVFNALFRPDRAFRHAVW